MPNELDQKNNFVLALRDNLKSLYRTESHYTHGEDDFEAQKVGSAYCLVRKDQNKPRDVRGFCFRKDLCYWPPRDEAEILKEVHDFSSRYKNLESVLGKESEHLKIKFGDKEYFVTSHIDGGYAGEISISFTELLRLRIA